jgi:deoxyribonuclease V
MIRTKFDPQWASIVEQWKQTQRELRQRMIVKPLDPLPRLVAGADVAFSTDKQTVYAAAVVYDRHEQRIVEIAHAHWPAEFPYVPGFLAFREGPALFDALAKLAQPYGAILFDGQGYAHPRRCGLAAYMSISLNLPGVGVAKSRLIGSFSDPPALAGSHSPLMDGDEQIGLVLRTRGSVKPLFMSLGHRVDLDSARQLVLACCTRYRVPEPTRQADIEVARRKRQSAAARGD